MPKNTCWQIEKLIVQRNQQQPQQQPQQKQRLAKYLTLS